LVSAYAPFTEFCDAALASPLMLNLDGKPIYLSSKTEGVKFDINGNGKKDLISWPLDPNTVLLSLDRNGNGNIDNVHELFGNQTIGPDEKKAVNGFEALRRYDLNLDNKIDANDPIFDQLRLWSDTNFNALSEAGELHSLASKNIRAIDLEYVEFVLEDGSYESDKYGNQTRQRSVIELDDGRLQMIFDIWFNALPGEYF